MSDLTYEDFKNRISIKTVLEDAGYVFNRRDGLRYPAFVRLDSEGRRIRGDKFIVTANGLCCFHPPEQRNYNVISFIKEFPDLFAEYIPGMDKNRLVNLVCNRLLGHVAEHRDVRILESERPCAEFNIGDYELQRFDRSDWNTVKKFYPFFHKRGLDLDTQTAFSPYFAITSRKGREDGKLFKNLSFPYRTPKSDKIVGMEERGYQIEGRQTYKGKAAGTNSVEGMWMAFIGRSTPERPGRIFWCESAYDAMAWYQLQRMKGETTDGLYISTGGNPAEKQFKGIFDVYPDVEHRLGFDRDRAGITYACNFIAWKKGLSFSSYAMQDGTFVFINKTEGYDRHEIPSDMFSFERFCREMKLYDEHVKYDPADEGYKDRNDQLLGKTMEVVMKEKEEAKGLHR